MTMIDFETFYGIFNEEWNKHEGGLAVPSSIALQRLYDRIAPLMVREFPEEEIRDIFDEIAGANWVSRNSDEFPRWNKRNLDDLKRLWEGQPEGDNILEQALKKSLPELEIRLKKLEDANRADPRMLDRRMETVNERSC